VEVDYFMKKEIKGLFIVALLLTSIVSSSYAFNMQSMNNTQLSCNGEVLVDSMVNIEIVSSSKTGAIVDCYDSNPCDNYVSIYDFSATNNKDLLKTLNDNIQKNAESNSTLSDIEVVGFDIKPINSDYFNVSVDENNIVKVTQLQDVSENEQVLFLSTNLIFRNKTTGDVANVAISNFLADKNPHIQNTNKKVVNPQIKPCLSPGFCNHACNLLGLVCTAAMSEIEMCAILGVGGVACALILAIGCYALSQGACPDACSNIPGPW
jgi:hypothetical protein